MNGISQPEADAGPLSPTTSPAGEKPEGKESCWRVAGVCLFLAAMVWVVFGQMLGHEFVNYDDEVYIAGNPVILGGLSLKGIGWAFTHNVNANWTPLTVISHMLDCQLYGTHAGWHHLTNVLLHTATAIVLFLVLRRMTGFLWRSAFVAAVFAIHPLHVESVAWIAERRDVLSGLFFMLTLGAYASYVCRPWSLARYLLVALMMTLGLMSKPMVVTLPLVLLLLDYWPLKRFTPTDGHLIPWRLIAEKLPLLALSGAVCVTTLFVQREVIESLPLALRISNALVSCVAYMGQMIDPARLAVLYPYPVQGLPAGEIITALLVLGFISAAVFRWWRTRPYLLVGWLWYLIMLVPVIGIVQVGTQTRADRYTYLPQIGLYLLLAWAAAELCAGWRHRRYMLGGLSVVILGTLIYCAHTQTSYWRNSESLWTHTLACTSDNFVAHNNLGNVLCQKGGVDEAMVHFQEALQIKPDFAQTHNNLGNAFLQKGNVDEAIVQYQTALQIKPDFAEAHNNLGNALLQKGDVDEAIAHYQKVLQIEPDHAEARNNLGSALLQKGQVDEAIAQYQKALQIKPGYAEAYHNLGNAFLQKGNMDEAIVQYQTALQIKPDFAEAHGNLGNALLQKDQVDEAIAQYQKLLQIMPDSAKACNNLGGALLQKGSMDEAIAQYQKALQIEPGFAEAHHNLDFALLLKGKAEEALTRYQQALQTNPDSVGILNNLAWLLATCPDAHIRDGVQAIHYAERACELTHYDVAIIVGTLAAAYAEAGRFDEAIAAAQKACALATAAGELELLKRNQELLGLYRAHQPYHELAEKFVPAAP